MSIVHGGGWVKATTRRKWSAYKLGRWSLLTFPLALTAAFATMMKIGSHDMGVVIVLTTLTVALWMGLVVSAGILAIFEQPKERTTDEKAPKSPDQFLT
jgi:hypothetical protein